MQPTPYERQADFAGFSASNPTRQQRGSDLDAEFNAIHRTLAQVLANIALIQRDDSFLANESVGIEQFNDAALALIGSRGFTIRGEWTTATAYSIGDIFIDGGKIYLVFQNHTSASDLAIDLAAFRVGGPIFDPAEIAGLRSDLQAVSGSGLVGWQRGEAGAVSRTVLDKLGDRLDVRDFGYSAIKTVAANTSCVQNAIAAAILLGKDLHFGGGAMALERLTVSGASNVRFIGEGVQIAIAGDMSDGGTPDNSNRIAFFMLSGSVSNVGFTGFRFTGDGNPAHKQRVFGYTFASPPALSQITIDDVLIDSVLIGGVFPGVQGLSVSRFKVSNTIGETPGSGLGFATEYAGATRPTNVKFYDGEFDGCTRHGLYINHCDGFFLSNLLFKNHRATMFSASTGTTGLAACILSRSTGGTVTNLQFVDCRDAGFTVDQDSTYTCQNIAVSNLLFRGMRGRSIAVGRTLGSGECKNIVIKGVSLQPTSQWLDPDVTITDVQGFTLSDVQFDGEVSYPSTHVVIDISEYDASYMKRVLVRDVRGAISLSSGLAYLVRVSSGLAASSGGLIELCRNDLEGATRLYLYGASGDCTNSNIRADWNFVKDITSAGTPSVAGYNAFNMALGSAGDITDFANGYEEQTIELYFPNGNPTLKNTNFYLAGGTDFVASPVDRMSMRRFKVSTSPDVFKWVEHSRSVNA